MVAETSMVGRAPRQWARTLLVVAAVASVAVIATPAAHAGAATNPAGPAPVPVIIDTDMYSNVDDVGGLAEAFALEMKGVDRVVAIGVDTRTTRPTVATPNRARRR